MGEWKEYKLSDLADKIGMGPFGSNIRVSTFVPVGIPVISGNHLHTSKLVDVDFNFISEEHAEKLKSSNVFRGDIIFTHAGNINNVAIIPSNSKYDRYVISQRQFYLRCNVEKLLPDFINYYFQSREGQYKLLANASSTGVPSIAQPVSYLKSVTILLPSLQEQIAIASILSSLDDKIDLLHRQNKTLETLAETLFRQWFVEQADESWEVGTLEGEFDFTMGQSPVGTALNENQVGMIFYQGRTDFGFRFPNPRVYTTTVTRMAKKFDTLVSVRAPVGDMNMAIQECCLGRGVAAFRYKINNNFYSYTYYKMRSLMEQIKQFEDSGTVFGSIGKDDFKNLENMIPSQKLIEKFQVLAKPLDDKIFSNTNQIRTLTQLRDTLLPKLMSGEVRVKWDETLSAEVEIDTKPIYTIGHSNHPIDKFIKMLTMKHI